MKYKVYLDALQCDRFVSRFMRKCDLGIEDVGIPVIISFTLDKEPTKEVLDKIIKKHEETKEIDTFGHYLTSVKLNRVEIKEEE